MTAPTISTIIKTVTKRAWSDLEPKLIAFLTTGLTASALIEAANYAGLELNPGLAAAIVTVVGGIAGYFKSSTSTTLAPEPKPAVVEPPVEVPAP